MIVPQHVIFQQFPCVAASEQKLIAIILQNLR